MPWQKAGVTVDVGAECGSVDEQVAQIKQAVDAGYDAIICNPVDATTALQLEVTAGDTPILFVNSQPDEQYLEPDKYMYVGSYDKDAGNFQATRLMQHHSRQNMYGTNLDSHLA